MLREDPATAPHAGGVLVIDDSGDRKDTAPAHVGRQWLGRLGKTDNAIVTVTTLWAMSGSTIRCTSRPYTPAAHFPRRRGDPAFRTKLQIGADSAHQAQAAGVAFRAVVADYGGSGRLLPGAEPGRAGMGDGAQPH